MTETLIDNAWNISSSNEVHETSTYKSEGSFVVHILIKSLVIVYESSYPLFNKTTYWAGCIFTMFKQSINMNIFLSSTWCEFDPNMAYVVCISICPYFLIWYPYAPTSLYGNAAHCSGYGVAMGCTMIWPLLFHGIRADVSETPDNALTTRMHGDYRQSIDRLFAGFNAICSTFRRNNPICIEGRNCRLIITLQCDILALVWLFGPANVPFWTCQCDFSALRLFPASGTLPRELRKHIGID